MDNKLALKPPDPRLVRSVLVDVAWFAGSAATAFGVIDLVRTGSVGTMLNILTTTEGG